MSADNWIKCPKCTKRIVEEQAEKEDKVKVLYGKIPEDEYRRKMGLVLQARGIEDTLREDYDIGIQDGTHFIIDYRASCIDVDCDYVFNYKKDIDIENMKD